MEIFKLIGSVMVDTADAEKSISKTSDQAEGLGKKLSNGIKTAGSDCGRDSRRRGNALSGERHGGDP